jgi:hypothetical protein
MRSYEVFLVSLGLLPIAILVFGAIGTFIFYVLTSLDKEDISDLTLTLGTIGLVTLGILMFMRFFCMRIAVMEMFDGQEPPPTIQELTGGVNASEAIVCMYIKQANLFIANKLGAQGQDDPSLVQNAVQNAINSVGAPITMCDQVWNPPADVGEALQQNAERITRMEVTLSKYVEPIFKEAYETGTQCKDVSGSAPAIGSTATEGFDDAGSTRDLAIRVATIQNVLELQKKNYLDPIEKRIKDLQSGKISDCDRRMGQKQGLTNQKTATAEKSLM